MTSHSNDPLSADLAAAHLLSGLSGALVHLATRDHRHWFVRKSAATPAGSSRLRRQAEKQKVWRARGIDSVRVPRILEEGEIDGRYFFDMEAVRGVDGITYLRAADYADVGRFANRLCDYLATASSGESIGPQPTTDLFGSLYDRVCEVQANTSLLSDEHAAAVLLGLSQLRKAGISQPTLCHGDFTLENLIVDADGVIWAFDLLDAPFEHYWHDVAKLHQDLDGGWYLRRQPPVARCITDYLSNRLLAAAATLDDRYPVLHSLFSACTFVRILPYVRDDASLEFVRQRVAHYARQIRAQLTHS